VDPVLGVLGALDDLPAGWRALCQLVLLEAAPKNWARAYQRMALQNPVSAERSGTSNAGTSLSSLITIFGLGLSAVVGLNAWNAWQCGEWGALVLTTAGLAGAIGLALAVYLRFFRRELHDPRLVQEKLSAKRAALKFGLQLFPRATPHWPRSELGWTASRPRIVHSHLPQATASSPNLSAHRPICASWHQSRKSVC
jgi:hypothetical protein